MSALGHTQTSPVHQAMSALPPKADKQEKARFVCFVPKADIRIAANCPRFDYVIGSRERVARVRPSAWGSSVRTQLSFMFAALMIGHHFSTSDL
jgi:hypothetical protein